MAGEEWERDRTADAYYASPARAYIFLEDGAMTLLDGYSRKIESISRGRAAEILQLIEGGREENGVEFGVTVWKEMKGHGKLLLFETSTEFSRHLFGAALGAGVTRREGVAMDPDGFRGAVPPVNTAGLRTSAERS
ncbi:MULTISPECIES: hypothetical protein [Frankia]|nr:MULTISPECIES: hypothetical protein [Frankia]KQC35291.1 hypothetical protein UK82_27395 [Frankia sp. ACN1ag]